MTLFLLWYIVLLRRVPHQNTAAFKSHLDYIKTENYSDEMVIKTLELSPLWAPSAGKPATDTSILCAGILRAWRHYSAWESSGCDIIFWGRHADRGMGIWHMGPCYPPLSLTNC